MLNFLHINLSLFSIVLPCEYPFKCKSPWINKNPMKLSKFLSKRWASFLACARFMKISPVVFSKGKLKMFVGLSMSRYLLFNFLEYISPIKTRLSSYFFPKTESFMLQKGKLGNLLFVLFVILNIGLAGNLSKFFQTFDLFSLGDSVKCAGFGLEIGVFS